MDAFDESIGFIDTVRQSHLGLLDVMSLPTFFQCSEDIVTRPIAQLIWLLPLLLLLIHVVYIATLSLSWTNTRNNRKSKTQQANNGITQSMDFLVEG